MTENIHTAMLAVYGEVGYVKKERGRNLDYTFASERALIEALRPAMVAAGIVCHVAEIKDVRQETYQTSRGTTMNRTSLVAVVRFVHAPSGTSIDAEAVGEGADAGDKSYPKALTGAYKYALRETFCIETGDDPDHQSSAEQERAAPAPRPPVGTGPKEPPPARAPKSTANDEAINGCAQCGAETEYREGTKATGGKWRGYFCTAAKSHAVRWLKSDAPFEEVPFEDSGEWANEPS